MKTKKILKAMNKFIKIFSGVALGAVLVVTDGFCASNGCDNENNSYINPEIALCSTHVYNIGKTENPTDENLRQVMRDVVALKTTLITQQLNKQYDFLDATVKRLKTQLEKAVLTAKFEAAGASPSETGNSTSSKGQNKYIAGAKDCNLEATNDDVIDCLRYNFNLINEMSKNGTSLTTDLRKQLAYDCKIASFVPVSDKTKDTDKTKDPTVIIAEESECTKPENINSREKFQDCLTKLNAVTRNYLSEQSKQQTGFYPWGAMR